MKKKEEEEEELFRVYALNKEPLSLSSFHRNNRAQLRSSGIACLHTIGRQSYYMRFISIYCMKIGLVGG